MPNVKKHITYHNYYDLTGDILPVRRNLMVAALTIIIVKALNVNYEALTLFGISFKTVAETVKNLPSIVEFFMFGLVLYFMIRFLLYISSYTLEKNKLYYITNKINSTKRRKREGSLIKRRARLFRYRLKRMVRIKNKRVTRVILPPVLAILLIGIIEKNIIIVILAVAMALLETTRAVLIRARSARTRAIAEASVVAATIVVIGLSVLLPSNALYPISPLLFYSLLGLVIIILFRRYVRFVLSIILPLILGVMAIALLDYEAIGFFIATSW